jgi:hypothetical protein
MVVMTVDEALDKIEAAGVHEELWIIIEYLFDSIQVAQESGHPDILGTVSDYASNTYGES